MTISNPLEPSRAGGGFRGVGGGAAPIRGPGVSHVPHAGRVPHPTGNPFQQRLFNARGRGGSLPSGAGAVDGGGQSQLLLERQKEKQADTLQTRTGGITMEEVMKDLRILEEQQQESEARLRQARLAKQQKQTALSNYEQSLQQSKYRNGRGRAHVLRKQEVLAKGQRAACDCTTGEEAARVRLQALGQELNARMELQRSHRAAEHRHDWKWEKCSRLRELVERALASAHEKVDAANKLRDARAAQQMERRNAIQAMSKKHQSILLETAQTQSRCNQLDRQVTSIHAEQGVLREEAANAVRLMEEEAKHLSQLQCDMERMLQSLQVEEQEILSSIQEGIDAKNEKKKFVLSLWEKIQTIRRSERHESPVASSALIQEPPPIDVGLIRQTVAVEAAALQEQRISLKALSGSVAALQETRDKTVLLVQAATNQASTAIQSNATAQDLVKQRQHEISKFAVEFERATRAQADCKGLIPAITEHREAILAELRTAEEELRMNKSDLSRLQAESSELKKEEAALALEYSRGLDEFNGSPTGLNESLQQAQASAMKLATNKSELTTLIKPADDFDASGVDADIRRLLRDHPRLVDISFERDAQLDDAEQFAAVLKPLRAECESRVLSAVKMGLALREAKKREEEERILVQIGVAEEAKRQEAARALHNKRLQQAETEEERIHREKLQRRKERSREERLRASNPAISAVQVGDACSAAKPRDLLERFSQASGGSSIVPDGIALSQAKKVHWDDDAKSKQRKLQKPDASLSRKGGQSHSPGRQHIKQSSLPHGHSKGGPRFHLSQVGPTGGVSTSKASESVHGKHLHATAKTSAEVRRDRTSTAMENYQKSKVEHPVANRTHPLKSSMKRPGSTLAEAASSRPVDTQSNKASKKPTIAADTATGKSSAAGSSSDKPIAVSRPLQKSHTAGIAAGLGAFKSITTKRLNEGKGKDDTQDVHGKSKRLKVSHAGESRQSYERDAPTQGGSLFTTDATQGKARSSTSQSTSQRHVLNDARRGTEMKALSRDQRTAEPAKDAFERRHTSKSKQGRDSNVKSTDRGDTIPIGQAVVERSSKQKRPTSHKGDGSSDYKDRERVRKEDGASTKGFRHELKNVPSLALSRIGSDGRRSEGRGEMASKIVTDATKIPVSLSLKDKRNPVQSVPVNATKPRRKPTGRKHMNWSIDDSRSAFM